MSLHDSYYLQYAKNIYTQCGEDGIIDFLLNRKSLLGTKKNELKNLFGKKYPMKKATGWLGELGIMVPGDAGMGMALGKQMSIEIARMAIGYMIMSMLRFPEYGPGGKIIGFAGGSSRCAGRYAKSERPRSACE